MLKLEKENVQWVRFQLLHDKILVFPLKAGLSATTELMKDNNISKQWVVSTPVEIKESAKRKSKRK